MTNTRGVFGLLDARSRIRKNTWVPPEEVYLNDPIPNTGYFGGGATVGLVLYSTMNKVSYASDTTTVAPTTAFLTVSRSELAATGNSTAGYFGGGQNPSTSTIEKVTYASDTIAVVPGAFLSVGRYGLAATGNSVSGYFGGGLTTGVLSTMDKITYSIDTTVRIPGGNLSVPRRQPAATGNSTAGYFGGGSTPPSPVLLYSTMDKVTYSSDTTAVLPTSGFLTYALSYPGATGNSTAGYFGGGSTPGPINYSTVDKISYSSDTRLAVPNAPISFPRYALAATGNSTSGYFGGGLDGTNSYSTMDKINYSTDTRVATISGLALISARYGLAASSLRANGLPSTPIANTVRGSNFVSKGSSFNTGYFGGGNAPGGALSTIDKTTYASDTTARVPGANLSSQRYALAATGNTTSGYFGGGLNPRYSTIDKVTYSSDTAAALPTTSFLIAARNYFSATGSPTAGYFVAGLFSPGDYSSVEKVTYSSDTTVAVPGAALNASRYGHGAAGNSTTGYFAAGYSNPPNVSRSDVEKITYASDTRAVVPSAALSDIKYYLTATGTSDVGYFAGGLTGAGPLTKVDKISYSTDTRSIAPSSTFFSVNRAYLGATSNLSSGYFAGGLFPGGRSTMEKVNYSTEIMSIVPGASLSGTRQNLAASSSTANALPQQDITATPQAIQGNTGYFGGGSQPGNVYYSTIDKLTYSTDTTAAVPGTGLSVPREYVSSTASFVAGYFGGGLGPGLPGGYTTMDKLTHSSDTAEAVPGAFLTAGPGGNYAMGSAGNSIAGYMAGGTFPGGTRSIVEKITYSTDTTAQAPSATLPNSRYGIGSAGNLTGGYFAGGLTPGGARSGTDRITYSTDSTDAVPSAFLLVPRNYHTATGNSTAGYFGGGAAGGVSSSIEKITYTTNTTSAVPSAVLSAARDTLAATGNSTAGYFGGGNLPSPVSRYSTIDKLSYSTETRSIAPGGLSVPRQGMGASSSVANAVRGTVPQVPIV